MKVAKYIALALLLVIIIGVAFFISKLNPVDRNDVSIVDVEIISGMSRADVGKLLYDDHLIKSATVFNIYSKVTHLVIIPGPYKFSPSDSTTKIAQTMSSGGFEVAKITIPEGWRATDMERYFVQDKGLTKLAGFAKAAQQYEGYLFPDTYEVKTDITIPDMITLLRDNFTTRTKGLKIDRQTIILASIVEREAKDDADRPIIAGVYINRLNAGMPLDADPTIQYAKGNWEAVSLSEYQSVISPYNTYLHIGLPPGPISNPGLKSINAVINYDHNSYYYFFTAQGTTYYSTTLQEHQAKVAQYF